MRWLVLASLLLAIFRAFRGYFTKSAFSPFDDSARHWTATIAHVQLMIGMVLYFQSPLVKSLLANFKHAIHDINLLFFGAIHGALMLVAIVLITIGSATAKRKKTDREKFKMLMIWFTVALVIIFIAIPWPFSPFSNRPYFR